MRSAIRRLLGPVFDAVVDRLDTTVELGDHLRFAAALLADGDPWGLGVVPDRGLAVHVVRANASSLGLAEPTWVGEALVGGRPEDLALSCPRFTGASYEVAEGREGIHLRCLSPQAVGSVGWPERASEPRESADWQEQTSEARHRALLVLTVLASERRTGPQVAGALQSLADGLAAHRWFLLKRGTLYGSANFLRALVAHAACVDVGQPAGADLGAYTRTVLDRLIRHLEVKREDALGFAVGSLPEDALPSLERLRFTLALLAASRFFGDARYLNTALKANDWTLGVLKAEKPSAVTPGRSVLLLHYLASLALQERAMKEFFGS